MIPRHSKWYLLPCTLAFLALTVPAGAQVAAPPGGAPPGLGRPGQPGTPGAPGAPGIPGQPGTDVGEKKVNLNLRDIPLRSALELLFQGTGFNFAVDAGVGNPLITINVKDLPFKRALQTLIRLATSQVPGLTYTDDGSLYLIKIRQPAAAPAEQPAEQAADAEAPEEMHWEKIPVNYNSVQLLAPYFNGVVLPTEDMLFMQGGMGGMGMGGMMGGMGGGMMGGMGGMM